MASAASMVTVTVRHALATPIADAGDGIVTTSGTTVRLNGSRSHDPDGRELTSAWTQIAGPAVEIANPTSVNPTVRAPDVTANTVLTFQLVVTNADGVVSPPATVEVFVQP